MAFVKKITSPELNLPISEVVVEGMFESIFNKRKQTYTEIEIKCLESSYQAHMKAAEELEKKELAEKAPSQSMGLLNRFSIAIQGDALKNTPMIQPMKLDPVVTLIHENAEALQRSKKLSAQGRVYGKLINCCC
jgi:hypothetical protein